VFHPPCCIDLLDDPFRLRLPKDSGLKVAVPRPGSDWLVAFHGRSLAARHTSAHPRRLLRSRRLATQFRPDPLQHDDARRQRVLARLDLDHEHADEEAAFLFGEFYRWHVKIAIGSTR
jgi:hypothetical protein